ncbi:MAG: cation diffusion facilitator family transporter [bacterium]
MSLSLAAGVLMFFTKVIAYVMTHSAAIMADAAESVVHLFAVGFAAYSLWLSMKPADGSHLYGHDRISFFSAGFEGAMIVVAAVFIIHEAVQKWLAGLQLQNIAAGAGFIAFATLINGALGWYLVRQGRKHYSLVLEANGKHVLTDSWTSLGVILALLLTLWTGWLPFDPLIAILVALNILWTGSKLIRRAIGGLMDEMDPEIDAKLREILQRETRKYRLQFHSLRHRNSGNKLLVECHMLFPEATSIVQAHELATLIEQEIHHAFPMTIEITTHLEPIESHDEIHEKFLENDTHGRPNNPAQRQ